MLPLPLDPEDQLPPHNRAMQRVTMDFSLLSVPLRDLLQDSDNHKQTAGQSLKGNHEENIQVFSVTFCDCWFLVTLVQISEFYDLE